MNTTTNIQRINSNSYPDILGLYVGLPRFLGESNQTYIQRLYEYSSNPQNNNVEGVLGQLNVQLGLELSNVATVTTSDPYMQLLYSPGLCTIITVSGTTYTCPTVEMAPDTYWNWIQVSGLVAFINAIPNYAASLIGADCSCRLLTKQSNLFTVTNETITSQVYTFTHSNIIPNSLLFNSSVPSYTLNSTNTVITFSGPIPTGLVTSYQYQVSPFSLVASPINIITLTDPTLSVVGINSNNQVAFQLSEAIYNIKSQDLSYWGA